jgi:hypothetical protein
VSAFRGSHEDEQHAHVAQQLLDGAWQQLAVASDLVELVGVGEQDEGARGDHRCRRLVAGREQQPERRHEGALVDLTGVEEVADRGADDVVRVAAVSPVDQPGHVPDELMEGLLRLRGVAVHPAAHLGARLVPLVVGVGDADEGAHRPRGDGQGEVGDQVGRLSLRQKGVDGLVDDLLDQRTQRGDPLDGEVAGEEPPVVGVLGGVHDGERRLGALGCGSVGRAREAPEAGRAEPVVGQNGADVVVPGDQPSRLSVMELDGHDGAGLAQLGLYRRRVERALTG